LRFAHFRMNRKVPEVSYASMPTAPTAPPGLRERKKRRTRATIAGAALELFQRDGFHATTIAAIAEAADVAPRTVSSYFPAKEDLAFPYAAETFERLERRLARREPGETTAEALRAWIRDELPEWEARKAEDRALRGVIAREEALQSYGHRFTARIEELIAAAIATDLGLSADDLEPRIAAAATTAIFSFLGAHRDQQERELPGEAARAQADEVLAVLDRALTFVGAGIRALQRARSEA
jgi:AcrR family transcriptional regulator